MSMQYRAVDAAVARAAVRKGTAQPAEWPDLTGSTPEYVRRWCDWLHRRWDDVELAEGIEIASPALAAALSEICSGRVAQPRRVRRAVESVLSYLLRVMTRATPFGLFAGVAPAMQGAHAEAKWGDSPRAVARPDAGWFSGFVAALEADHDVLRTLPVMANTLAVVRGDRLILPSQPRVDDAGVVSPADVEMRHSKPVQAVLRAARSPVCVGDLAATLAVEFPGTPEPVIDKMLNELVATGVLVSGLRPPMDVTDPLGHLLDQLDTGPARRQWRGLGELEALRRTLGRYADARTPAERRDLAVAASAQMTAVYTHTRPLLAVDTRLDAQVVLPRSVIAEGEAAASVLVRLTPHPHGNPAWRSWHGMFLDRYGQGSVVPLAEVVDADRGLGYPAGYRGSPHSLPTPVSSARDHALLRLAQRALLDGSGEILLDETSLAELTTDGSIHRPPHVVPHTELRFRVHAPTLDAVDKGAFTLVVASAARQAGASLGRFLYLFDTPDRDRIGAAFAALPTLNAGAITAQVTCPPLSPRAQNYVRAPALFPLISLGEHRLPDDQAQIPVDDLAVTADAHRLFLVRLSTGQVVEPLVHNALEFRHATHPLARFLAEITTARAAACVPFSWGAAAALSVLPRVRYGRSVLRSACWQLRAADLPAQRASQAEWERAWETLRGTYRIPSTVYLGERDVVLGVNLDEPAHRALLRSHLHRAGSATLTEAPDDDALGWIDGRAHEISLPMARTDPPLETPAAMRRRRPLRVLRHTGHLPGASAWLYARLHTYPRRQTELLTEHLPQLLACWPPTASGDLSGAAVEPRLPLTWPPAESGRMPSMWFLRYHDRTHAEGSHVRIRIRLETADDYSAAARRVGAWADRLRRAGLLNALILDTYRPEIGRYGTGPALAAAESAFAADSAAAIAQLAATTPAGPRPQVLTAASLIDLAEAFLGARDEALRWLIEHITHQGGPGMSRDQREHVLRLTDPYGGPSVECGPAGAERLAQAWEQRRPAVQAYRALLTESDDRPDPDRVLLALLHLHHARMIGTDAESERLCLRLARAAALSWVARSAEGTPHAPGNAG